jgi:hypothetical protein
MRQIISGMVAAVAVMMTAGAAPAMACGGGLFSSCSPCAYAAPCAPPVYVAPVYSGCNTGCGGWGHERLANPVHQYYHVNQGPTYTGPGNWAPRPVYEEDALPVYPRRYGYRGYGYGAGYGAGYGYGVGRGYVGRGYGIGRGYGMGRGYGGYGMRHGAYRGGARFGRY